MKVTGVQSVKWFTEIFLRGSTSATPKGEPRVESEPVSGEDKGRKRKAERNATSAGYRSFVSKHDTNASLKERAPSVSA